MKQAHLIPVLMMFIVFLNLQTSMSVPPSTVEWEAHVRTLRDLLSASVIQAMRRA